MPMVDIADLLGKIDIVDYISQYIELEERDGEFFSICPFHDDTDPSFSVTRHNGLFYCFGCKKAGNVINFIQNYDKKSFKEAVEKACDYLGGDVNIMPEQLEATRIIKKFKPKPTQAKKAKYKRLPDDVMSKYEFNIEKLKPWLDDGIQVDILKKYQVRYDSFANRIVFPIRDDSGHIINVKGRTLEKDSKERKIPKYQNYYDIGIMDYVFNLDEARENIEKLGFAVIFEAEKSVMLAEGYGINNSIALMTSALNDYQLEILVKLGADVVFALDKDQNISHDKNINKLKRYVKVGYLLDTEDMLGEKDSPIDKGRETFIHLYKNRRILR